ncbi:hypothetical protein C5S30_05130 [ANME-1 cluster archaeon GoMg4]|nr:hypothetical protein [ANME-1 cluster archaeon GoMg4]
MMHSIYLPFTEKQLLSHFADVRQNGKCIKNTKLSILNTTKIVFKNTINILQITLIGLERL